MLDCYLVLIIYDAIGIIRSFEVSSACHEVISLVIYTIKQDLGYGDYCDFYLAEILVYD